MYVEEEITFLEIVRAYKQCRIHKSNCMSKLDFEYNLERNLSDLYEQLRTGTYKIGQSTCFVIVEPKVREVWAADFRDRVVHHFIYNRISKRFYNRFIRDTYSCIPERGTHNAAKQLYKYAKKITNNYKKNAYYMKCDLKNFFVSIDKDILFEELKKHVKDEFLLKLLYQVVYDDLKNKAIIKSSQSRFRKLPYEKSLWNTPDKKGLPIGNLTSQFFSNVYLNILDQYVKHKLKCKYYCRYVDDFVMLSEDPQQLVEWYRDLSEFLKTRLKLELHRRKKMINKLSQGVDFVGFVIKPNHVLLRQKTIKKIYKTIREFKTKPNWYEQEEINRYIRTINSYLGMLRGVNGYNMRQDICAKSINLFISCDEKYTKLESVLKKSCKIVPPQTGR